MHSLMLSESAFDPIFSKTVQHHKDVLRPETLKYNTPVPSASTSLLSELSQYTKFYICKGLGQPNMKIKSSFTHHDVV